MGDIHMDTTLTFLRRHHRSGDPIDYVIMLAVYYCSEKLLVKIFPDMQSNNRRVIAVVAAIVVLIIFKTVKLIAKNNVDVR